MAFTDLLTNLLQPWMKIRVYTLAVDSGVLLFPNTAHTAGFVLTDDGKGNATWQAPGGGGGGVASIRCPDVFSPESIVFNSATGAVTARCSGNFGAATIQTTGSATLGTNLTVDDTTSTSVLSVLDTSTLGGDTIIANTGGGSLRITGNPVTHQVLTCQDDVLGDAEWQALPVQNILAQDASIDVFPLPNGVFKVQATGQFGTNPVAGGTLSGTALTATGAGNIAGQLTFANGAPASTLPPAVLTCTNAFGAAQWAQLYSSNNNTSTTLPVSQFLTPSPGVGVTPTLLIDQPLATGWYLVNASIYCEAETDGVQWTTCFYLQTTAGAGDQFIGQQATEFRSPLPATGPTNYEFSTTSSIQCLVQITHGSDHLQLMGSTRNTGVEKVYVRARDTASGGSAKVITQLSSFLLFQ